LPPAVLEHRAQRRIIGGAAAPIPGGGQHKGRRHCQPDRRQTHQIPRLLADFRGTPPGSCTPGRTKYKPGRRSGTEDIA
jgi:hypothetical protein